MNTRTRKTTEFIIIMAINCLAVLALLGLTRPSEPNPIRVTKGEITLTAGYQECKDQAGPDWHDINPNVTKDGPKVWLTVYDQQDLWFLDCMINTLDGRDDQGEELREQFREAIEGSHRQWVGRYRYTWEVDGPATTIEIKEKL